MKSVFSWLICALAVMFWIFRVIVCIMATINVDFIVAPSDLNMEVITLFLTIPCLILIFKRNVFGGLAYFGLYGWYFGMEVAIVLEEVLANSMKLISMDIVVQVFVGIVAFLLSFMVLLDVVFSQYSKKDNPSKKVDWFYKNENFDREKDERADKNNYRIY